jgi:hypothetical protein
MNLYMARIAIILAVLPPGAPAIKPRELNLPIRVKALDINGHSVNDLPQSDFTLRVDGTDNAIEWWRKEQDWFQRSTYTIAFKAIQGSPARQHLIEISVSRPHVSLRYERGATW